MPRRPMSEPPTDGEARVFPRTLVMTLKMGSDGRLVGTGCAGGQQVRYEIIGERGAWQVETCYPSKMRRFSWERHSVRDFPTLSAAHNFVRSDFSRRQLIRAVA